MTEKNKNNRFYGLDYIFKIIVTAFIYFSSAGLSLLLAIGASNATSVWPPSGIALAVIFLWGYRMGPAIFFGALLSNLLFLKGTGLAPEYFITASFITAVGNMSEGIIGVYLIKRFTETGNPFDSMKDLFVFIIFGSFIGTLISPSLGVSSYCIISGQWSSFIEFWFTWWLGDAAGILIVSPLIILVKKKNPGIVQEVSTLEVIVIFLVLTAGSIIIFRNNYQLQYVIIPPLLWIAFRFGRIYSASAVLIVSAIALICTVTRFDSSGNQISRRMLLFLQTYIGVISITTLCLSVLAHVRSKSDRLRSEAQKQLYDIIELLPDPTFAVNKRGKVITWNRAIEILTGISKNDMIGKSDYEYSIPFYGERSPMLIDIALKSPDHINPETGRDIEIKGNILFLEQYNPLLDRYLSGSATALINGDGIIYGAIESIRDISDRKKAELDLNNYKEHLEEIVKERSAELLKTNEQLIIRIENQERAEKAHAESEKKYRDLVESVNNIIIRWKPDGCITFFNTYAQKFFGFSESEVIGKNIVGIIVPARESSGRDLALLLEDIVRNPDNHVLNENENIRKDGERVWIAWTNKLIFDESGSIIEILSVGSDLTLRRSMEESLRTTLNELAVAKDRAEAADRIKSAFLATMSHEIRTPLNAILGYSQILLREKALSPESKREIEIINSSGEHLLDLINEILDMSKIEAGKTEIINESFSLFSVMKQIENLFIAKTTRSGIEFDFKISDDTPDLIVTDKSKLKQILINLVGNAVKFTDRGFVKVDVSTSGSNAETLTFTVADTGKGIAEEHLENIFVPFEQTVDGKDRGGTGLGLSISRKYAEFLGGDITVKSEINKGTSFKLNLPCIKSNIETINDTDMMKKVIGIHRGIIPRILIVDDREVNRDILVKMLEPIGFPVKEASGGKESLDLIRKWNPELVLLDLVMPDIDGRDVIRFIKSDPLYAGLKIFVITASVLDIARDEILELGANAFIRKPFREKIVLNEIRDTFGLEYIYSENESENEQIPAVITESELLKMLAQIPSEIRENLKNALIIGDIEEIQKAVKDISFIDPTLTKQINFMINDFEFSSMIEMLNTASNNS